VYILYIHTPVTCLYAGARARGVHLGGRRHPDAGHVRHPRRGRRRPMRPGTRNPSRKWLTSRFTNRDAGDGDGRCGLVPEPRSFPKTGTESLCKQRHPKPSRIIVTLDEDGNGRCGLVPETRIHAIILMMRWTGLAPWEFECPFSGSLAFTCRPGTCFSAPETTLGGGLRVRGTFATLDDDGYGRCGLLIYFLSFLFIALEPRAE
jgi:hypothetical protein